MAASPSRRTVRLTEYDYSSEGAYFITICTQQKEHRFGHIASDTMWLNEAGRMIEERIRAIPLKFEGVSIDSYVVMPNHVHFIITLPGGNVGATHSGRPLSDRQGREHNTPIENPRENDSSGDSPGMDDPGNDNNPGNYNPGGGLTAGQGADQSGGPGGPKAGDHCGSPLRLGQVVGWFKASSTNYYIAGVKGGRYPAFDRRLWQRNYYEHIIRNEAAYQFIDEYIQTNAQRWFEDRLR